LVSSLLYLKTNNQIDPKGVYVKLRFFVFSPMLLTCMVSLLTGVSCSDQGVGVYTPPAEDGRMYTVAGQAGEPGNDGDGGPAVNSNLYWPADVTPLPNGELLIVDFNNHRIRKISSDGIIDRLIGSGFLGDDRKGPATSIDLNHPTDVKIGPNGNYWIATFHNWCLKEIDAATMVLVRAIGDTARGYRGDFPENGGSITATARPRFDLPSSLLFDEAGFIYVMDQGNARIRKIDLQTGIISFFVGGTKGNRDGVGAEAQFSLPGAETVGDGERGGGMDLAPNGEDIYVADTENHTIRRVNIPSQSVTTIAGTGEPGWEGDGGSALSAQLSYPTDVACAANGDIYVADNHNHVIRKIDIATGIITTVAGFGVPTASPDGTPAKEAGLNQPFGVAVDRGSNTLYIADSFNHQIKKVRNP
jgi:DNA-binding beta-propeller fold protein YncE